MRPVQRRVGISPSKGSNIMSLVELPYFLNGYLSADPNADIPRALGTFASKEPESFDILRRELRQLLSSATDIRKINDVFRTRGLFLLPESQSDAHRLLREIYIHAEAIKNADFSRKPYDVFISYSSPDRPLAARLAKDLTELGYVVWLDTWELLIGHNIVDEIYKSIISSQFVVTILTPNSVQSRWLNFELNSALLSEIESRQVVILPAKFGDCEIPGPLRNRRHFDLTVSWQDGVRELTAAIDFHQAEMRFKLLSTQPSNLQLDSGSFEHLRQWRMNLLPAIESSGFQGGSAFKDVLIGPIDSGPLSVGAERLRPMIDSSRVWINRWGGPPFPYAKFTSTQEFHMPDGLRYVDTRSWPYRLRSFHFWQVNYQFQFLQRSYIDEDSIVSDDGESYFAGGLVKSWALVDIVAPLLFARNLLLYEPGVRSLGVTFIWGGLRTRRLLELAPDRLGFLRDYYSDTSEWSFGIEVRHNTSVVLDARIIALDLFRHFQWSPDGDALAMLNNDLESLRNGNFPG